LGRYHNFASLPWIANFDINCEFCGESFSFIKKYETKFEFYSYKPYSTIPPDMLPLAKAQQQKEQNQFLNQYSDAGVLTLNRWKIGTEKCPKCGYIQSWLIRSAKNDNNPYRNKVWLTGALAPIIIVARAFLSSNPSYPFGSPVDYLVYGTISASILLFLVFFYKARRFNREFDPNSKVLGNRPKPHTENLPKISFITAV
jgi:hypothetical protein